MAKDQTFDAGDLGAAILNTVQSGLAIALKQESDGRIRIWAIEMPTAEDRADAELEAWLDGRDQA